MVKKNRGIVVGLVCLAAVVVLLIVFGGGAQDFRSKYEGADLSADVTGISRGNTYDYYLSLHADAESGDESIAVDVASFEGDAEARPGDQGTQVVYTPDSSFVTWKVNVEKAGMYYIMLDYLTVESRGVDVERELYINGEVPFSGASTLCFSRLWTDVGEVRKDNQGNDIRPTQVERFEWQRAYCRDSMGYQTEPYAFYFQAGENTLSLKAVNEPAIIGGITLTPISAYATYAQYLSDQPQVTMTDAGKNYSLKVQGESAELRSSPSLYARYDRSSGQTEPSSVTNTILNYIGGDPWTHPGEWIEWDFSVPEDGYYNISIKARQMYQRGALSSRTVYIDGQVPFDALSTVTFGYNTSWDMRTLGDQDGNPYRFYLTKGDHTIRMEVTLGEMGPVLKRVEDSIFRLNQIYRKILVLTGANPDRFRDYNLASVYPDVIRAMSLESKRLYQIVDDTVAITGQKSDRVAVAQTLAVQLEQFVENNDKITESFTNFKDNITSLGTAMQNMSESKLDVDLIMITGENAKVPKVGENFFQSFAHEIKSCVSSYFVDYNSLGDKYEDNDDVLEIWITTGRDQSTVLKTMVDDTFTAKTGIKVNVKLVAADAILTAVVAGNGPDIVISVSGWFAVNYAMRNAVEDLTQFPDYAQVVEPFYDSILTPLTYDNGKKVGVYGLPETQNFSLLFYRSDVMEELGLAVPQTWDDLIAILPTIQGNSLTVAVPFPDIGAADISVLNSLIYQNGGFIYDQDAKHTLIDSESGVTAFKLYTSLYNDYGLPTVFDFVSRFRSGEMPLGLASYATYNTLMVSAPEIRGLWDFTLFPGTIQADGTIDRTANTDGLCCMMVATDDQNTKNNAWEFMKWWVSADAQVRFGREMESVLGASARYQTANRDALRQLAWSKDQLQVLEEQMSHTRGFPEIAGGYSTTRHITNAIRRVINTKEDPRETLLNYARTINEEIKIKRQEFNLPVD
ncbi:MAG: extracellular solute-binding protein [Clostridia bacterium]|nr:extracellular solute-binding protein [Clostridia bacterium]